MKRAGRIISLIIGSAFTMPFIFLAYALKPALGRKISVQFTGKLLSQTAAFAITLLIPRANETTDYSTFQKRIKRHFAFVERIYDLRVARETEDTIEFRINFCPVVKMLRKFGMPELCKYSCAGDWIIAKRNQRYWTFNRDHTIGTGGTYCNHTYCRNNHAKIYTAILP